MVNGRLQLRDVRRVRPRRWPQLGSGEVPIIDCLSSLMSLARFSRPFLPHRVPCPLLFVLAWSAAAVRNIKAGKVANRLTIHGEDSLNESLRRFSRLKSSACCHPMSPAPQQADSPKPGPPWKSAYAPGENSPQVWDMG
ncbi:hypothetical protein CABS01_11865 [Colletotrichum abscissum]|uniref:uncharacterized protein n=1 Tax=Colletotrichum abscissum TaxID=1671311 RepID=UPI0027D72840|nr:uncharacterized protein CABS01_11865 [Colletotrichum abscissum]KAK1492348.1 hypothetical protein CABS01_11865 [Colletotrichum abscissum]